jgi:hypothetical protein
VSGRFIEHLRGDIGAASYHFRSGATGSRVVLTVDAKLRTDWSLVAID